MAGNVRAGHAARVARHAAQVARSLGMGERAVVDVEYAALLHDIGQVALRRPIPSGATVLAAPADQERIATRGAEVVAHTGWLRAVAVMVAEQSVPYHEVVARRRQLGLGGRILKVCNAFDDHLGEALRSHHPTPRAASLERLHLGLGHEYDPRIVRVLEREIAASLDLEREHVVDDGTGEVDDDARRGDAASGPGGRDDRAAAGVEPVGRAGGVVTAGGDRTA